MSLRHASVLAKSSSVLDPSGAVFCIDKKSIAGGYSLVPDRLAESNTALSGVQVAMALALKSGVALDKSILCSTHGFGEEIAKLLILAGIRQVETYTPCTDDAIELLEDAGITVLLKTRSTK